MTWLVTAPYGFIYYTGWHCLGCPDGDEVASAGAADQRDAAHAHTARTGHPTLTYHRHEELLMPVNTVLPPRPALPAGPAGGGTTT